MSLNKKIYGNMYSQINMNTMPGEMRLPGKTAAQQAESVDYQDIPRDIQAMRVATYNKEVKEGEFVPEFSGASNKRRGLAGYLGDAAQKTAPGLLLAGALLALYWMFFRKEENVEVEEIIEEPIMNPEENDDDFEMVEDDSELEEHTF